MDLIGGLSKALGVDPTQAEALAGAALATVKGQVAVEAGPDEVAKLEQAVPELDGWVAKARAEVADAPAGGGLGGLLGGLAGSGAGASVLGALGGQKAQDAALFAALLGKLGLDAQKAAMAAPLVAQFLESRVDPVWMGRIRSAAPFLTGKGGGAAGLLGGLLG